MERQDRFVKQQKLMILMAIVCFVLLVVVVALGWYVFDYSGNKMQKNNETAAELLKNINLENSNKASDTAQTELPYDKTTDLSKNEPINYANLNAEEVVKLLSKHILLTEGDVTVASITNIDGLRADYPELFTYAKNGDKLIFYSLGIIIFDPALDRVVDVIRRLPTGTIIPKSVDETK